MTQEKIVAIADSVTVGELAETLNLPVTTLVGELFKNGIAATINQRLDFDTATIVVEELGLDVKLEKKSIEAHARKTHELTEGALPRPPIVAVYKSGFSCALHSTRVPSERSKSKRNTCSPKVPAR